jgi:hypothetical protein
MPEDIAQGRADGLRVIGVAKPGPRSARRRRGRRCRRERAEVGGSVTSQSRERFAGRACLRSRTCRALPFCGLRLFTETHAPVAGAAQLAPWAQGAGAFKRNKALAGLHRNHAAVEFEGRLEKQAPRGSWRHTGKAAGDPKYSSSAPCTRESAAQCRVERLFDGDAPSMNDPLAARFFFFCFARSSRSARRNGLALRGRIAFGGAGLSGRALRTAQGPRPVRASLNRLTRIILVVPWCASGRPRTMTTRSLL